MTLLIDAGNSAVKWARWTTGGGLVEGGRIVHRDSGDLAERLHLMWRDLPPGLRAVGCAVAGDKVVNDVQQAVQQAGLAPIAWRSAQPVFHGSFELVNGYRDAAQLGADRWHALLGACSCWPRESLLVVSAGTATTVDCVQAATTASTFVGGCIAPGVRMMLQSLASGTAGLPLADGEAADFPLTTADAIASGVLDAQAGLVERVFRRFSMRLAAAPRVVLAGGHAEMLAGRLPVELAPVIEHNLVLLGLALRASSP